MKGQSWVKDGQGRVNDGANTIKAGPANGKGRANRAEEGSRTGHRWVEEGSLKGQCGINERPKTEQCKVK